MDLSPITDVVSQLVGVGLEGLAIVLGGIITHFAWKFTGHRLDKEDAAKLQDALVWAAKKGAGVAEDMLGKVPKVEAKNWALKVAGQYVINQVPKAAKRLDIDAEKAASMAEARLKEIAPWLFGNGDLSSVVLSEPLPAPAG